MTEPPSGAAHDQNQRIELVTPTLDMEAACRACEAAFAAAGEVFLGQSANDWPAFVHRCAEEAAGRPATPDRVPQTVFILTRSSPDGSRDTLGVSKLRHFLTPTLEDIGGHIGYNIRPDERGKGYGRLILALTLPHARALGLARVLLTCDTDNIRSARVIMANGGVLTSEGLSPLRGARVSRYWIAL
ncbi:MAG TPA: GNAT family N-acetyltransferase [Ktedonobacterales bacterium]|nr:GNAT family N-acetyltransferase [Ktedonobacterales bacterium]